MCFRPPLSPTSTVHFFLHGALVDAQPLTKYPQLYLKDFPSAFIHLTLNAFDSPRAYRQVLATFSDAKGGPLHL